MARFLVGLNWEIANSVELQRYVELEDMVHMTIKMENQLKRRGNNTWQNPSLESSRRPNFVKKEKKQAIVKPKIEQKQEAINHGNQGKFNSSTNQNRVKRQGRGHIVSQCKKKKSYDIVR